MGGWRDRTRHEAPTPTQRDILDLAARSGLTGLALAKAIAAERGIRFSSAQGHIDRLVRKGLLSNEVKPIPSPAVLLLRDAGRFLFKIDVGTAHKDELLRLRERILEMVGGDHAGH